MSKSNRGFTFVLAFLSLCSGLAFLYFAKPVIKSVRVIYLVPSDRKQHVEYQKAIEECVVHLQQWYASQMDGKTFRLNDPIVEVHQSTQAADWFNTNKPPNDTDQKHYTTYNAVNELCQSTGFEFKKDSLPVTHADSNTVWLIYIDAPGGTGAGDDGFAVLPQHDLRGLVGASSDGSPIRRWIGGSGHELGHGFGLVHPADDPPTAIMKRAYSVYPDCELTLQDKYALSQSPFFEKQDDGWNWNRNAVTSLVAFVVLTFWLIFIKGSTNNLP